MGKKSANPKPGGSEPTSMPPRMVSVRGARLLDQPGFEKKLDEPTPQHPEVDEPAPQLPEVGAFALQHFGVNNFAQQPLEVDDFAPQHPEEDGSSPQHPDGVDS